MLRGTPGRDHIAVGDAHGILSRVILYATWDESCLLTVERNEYACDFLEIALESFGLRSVVRWEQRPALERIALEEGFARACAVLVDVGSLLEVIEGADRGAVIAEDTFLYESGVPYYRMTLFELAQSTGEFELSRLLLKTDDALFAGQIAQAIVRERSERGIETIGELVRPVKAALRDQPPAIATSLLAQTLVVLAAEVAEVEDYLSATLRDCSRILVADGLLMVIAYSNHQEQLVRDATVGSDAGWVELRDSPLWPNLSDVDEDSWVPLARLLAFRWQPAHRGAPAAVAG